MWCEPSSQDVELTAERLRGGLGTRLSEPSVRPCAPVFARECVCLGGGHVFGDSNEFVPVKEDD